MTIVEAARGVTGGVDTHLDFHVAAAWIRSEHCSGTESFETDPAGYKALLKLARGIWRPSPKSASRAPVPMGPDWPASCAKPRSR